MIQFVITLYMINIMNLFIYSWFSSGSLGRVDRAEWELINMHYDFKYEVIFINISIFPILYEKNPLHSKFIILFQHLMTYEIPQHNHFKCAF